MRTTSLKSALGLATVGAALAFVATGCGTATNHATNAPQPQDVRLTLTTPTTGLRTSADRIAVRGTVSPPNATVQIQGRPAAVGNGVFTGTATVHSGRTTVDVVASAPGSTPAATSIAITRPASRARAKALASSARVVTPVVVAGSVSARDTSCGAGVVAGPNTTCAFAENVRAAYHGAGTAVAYSPVTNQTYVMTCSAGPAVVCTGANDASVSFSVAPASSATASKTNCGPRLSAGPNTTCAFAERVRTAYQASGPGRVRAYSPVTGRTYLMTCVASSPVVCTGADHASVTIW